MSNLPDGFSDIVSSASYEQCKSMLIYLKNFINQPKNTEEVIDFNQYTSHTSNFVDDALLKETISPIIISNKCVSAIKFVLS